MLTRVARRRYDDAVRAALGATRRVIGRLWMAEVLLLAIAGGVLGLATAGAMVTAIVSLAPDDLPRLDEIAVDPMVAAFTFAAVMGTAIVTSAMPLRQAARVNPLNALEGVRTTAGPRSLRARSALLVVQIGLAVVLLVAAGLVLRSFLALRQVDLGFQPDRVLALAVMPGNITRPPNAWLNDLLARVRTLPGVQAAGAIYLRPLMLGPIGQGVLIYLEGQSETPDAAESNPTLNHQIASPGYFEAMRIQLRSGRFFSQSDTAAAPRVAIVSESTARRLWPGQDPLGKKLMMSTFTPGGPRRAWRTVVGVVSDVRYRGLEEVQLDVYDPALQVGRPADTIVVRTDGDPMAVATHVRTLARGLDATSIVDGVTSMDAVVSRAQAPWRLTMWLFVVFAVLAFVVAALGLFSVVALDVAQRSREFAIRLALGAAPATVVRGVLARAGWRVLSGVGAGMLVAVAARHALRGLLFGVAPDDLSTYAAVLGLVLAAVALAAYLPARRAVRVDPQALLRER